MTPMPRYVLSVQGGPADMRGEPEDSPTHQLVTGRAFTALIRPETDVAGPVAAHAYWQVGDRQIPAELQLDVSHQGAVRVKGTAVALDTREQSPVQLFILIASPEVLKGITADANSLGDVDASGQVSVHRLSVVTAGPE